MLVPVKGGGTGAGPEGAGGLLRPGPGMIAAAGAVAQAYRRASSATRSWKLAATSAGASMVASPPWPST